MIPFQIAIVPVLGYLGRIVWKRLPGEQKILIIEKINGHRKTIIAGGVAYLSVCGIFYATHTELMVTTGRRRLKFFTSQTVAGLTNYDFEDRIRDYDDLVLLESNIYCKRVASIVSKIIECNVNEFPGIDQHLKWTFSIVDDAKKNAESNANGDIIICRGILDFCKDDGELAALICHEMSHLLLDHHAERKSRNLFYDVLIAPFLLVIWIIVPTVIWAITLNMLACALSYAVVLLPHNRETESEADIIGLQMAARSCFDIRGSVSLMTRFDNEQKKNFGLTASKLFNFFNSISSHPSYIYRGHHMESLLEAATILRERCNCAALPGEDPRDRIVTEIEAKLASENPLNKY